MAGIVGIEHQGRRLPAALPSVDEQAPLGELLNILRRRRVLILSVIFIFTTLATLYGLSREPTYTATAAVLIGSPEDRAVDSGQYSQPAADAWRMVATQATVIQSMDVIVAAMDKLGLFQDPEFAPVPDDDQVPHTLSGWLPGDWLAATGMAATRWLPDEWHATEEEHQERDQARIPGEDTAGVGFDRQVSAMAKEIAQIEEQVEARERAIDAFSGGLNVSPSNNANVVWISYTYPEPTKAAMFANAVIEAYLENQRRQMRASADAGYAWVSDRLQAMQDEVLAAEDAVEKFRAENRLAPTGGTALSEVQLADLNRELITTRAERAETEAKLRLIRDLRASGGNLDSIAEVVASPLIGRLREQEVQLVQMEAELATTYGPRHPRMEELRREREDLAAGINGEINRIARSLENQLTVIRTREENLARELEGVRSERAVEDQTEVRLRQLEREAAAKRTVYENFLARQQELKARDGALASNVQVLAPARAPSGPSSPSPMLFAVVGFTASTVLGCMLGLVREQLDKSLHSERQVERALGLPCLGVIPQVKHLKRDHDALAGYLCDRPRSAYAEGIRALYAALLVSENGAVAPKAVLFTSALPGEGKTATASSLAVSAARAGHKVLLVDLDLRRPSVAREFGHRPHGGVAEVIAGDQSLEEALITDEATGIDILPVHSSPADTTALLTSQRVRALLGELRRRYDFVVLDSPPLLAVTDARLLALCADTTVFIVRWRRTKADAAVAGLKVLRDAGAHVAGAVLTQINVKKHARLSYGDGMQYYASYNNYYRS